MTEIQTCQRVIRLNDKDYQIVEKYNLDLLERVRKVKRMRERLKSMPYDLQLINLKSRLFKEPE